MADRRALLTHIIDQLQAELESVLRDMAPLVAAYHTALVKQGKTAPEAITLALDAQRQILADYIMAVKADDGDG
jgi:hypothetical protein